MFLYRYIHTYTHTHHTNPYSIHTYMCIHTGIHTYTHISSSVLILFCVGSGSLKTSVSTLFFNPRKHTTRQVWSVEDTILPSESGFKSALLHSRCHPPPVSSPGVHLQSITLPPLEIRCNVLLFPLRWSSLFFISNQYGLHILFVIRNAIMQSL